jgi:putative acetyltransferase
MVVYKTAQTDTEFEHAKGLFEEYAGSLHFDLSFQNFSNELNSIQSQYNKPEGGIILAYANQLPVGCAGVRKLEENIAELKRMYVNPAYRGYKIGLKLLELSLGLAKDLHYKKIRLDTVDTMQQAIKLYRSLGFYSIPAYRYNPMPGTIYMEKELD